MFDVERHAGVRMREDVAVRLTEFWELMNTAFGSAYAESLARDQALSACRGQTAIDALAAGEPPKEVWRAIAEQFELPARLR